MNGAICKQFIFSEPEKKIREYMGNPKCINLVAILFYMDKSV